MTTIAVLGTGYLGATHAAGMAELGFDVVGLDTDADKVARLASGAAPFYEPGLDELLARHVASGRLRFTTSVAEAAAQARVFFVCVGTPQGPQGGAADLSAVFGAVDALVPRLTRDALVVGKSTVPVGTAARLAGRIAESARPGVRVDLAWAPSSCARGMPCRTRCVRTGSSSASTRPKPRPLSASCMPSRSATARRS